MKSQHHASHSIQRQRDKREAVHQQLRGMQIQRQADEDWVPDKNGDLYYDTKGEAETRMKTLQALGEWKEYRVKSFEVQGKTKWRVEMRYPVKSSEPEGTGEGDWIQDQGGDLYYDTQGEADNRLKKLQVSGEWKEYRVKSFTVQGETKWRVEMRGPVKPPDKTDVKTTDTKTTNKNVTYRGDLKGKKRLLVSWSIDDGPRGKTTENMKKTGMGGIPQATWFIQYANITKDDWQKLRDIQTNGGEIAIHSFYPDDDHAAWFPKVKGNAYGTKHIDDDMATRMAQLAKFKTKLNEEKIYPMFIRLPGGLISELSNYVTQLGHTTGAGTIASKIIKGEDVSSYRPKVDQVVADFALLKKTMNELNLMLWGGGGINESKSVDPKPESISRQEWTEETSGAKGRYDYTTNKVDPSSKTAVDQAAKKDVSKGYFESLIATMKDGDVKGMVILTHDTANGGEGEQDDVRAVKEDRELMEKTCEEKGILLEYHTMSSLFKEITGHDRATYKPKY